MGKRMLRALEDRIDEITNSSKWIEPYVHPHSYSTSFSGSESIEAEAEYNS
jgi:hypothetical protein